MQLQNGRFQLLIKPVVQGIATARPESMVRSLRIRGRFIATVFIAALAACGQRQDARETENHPTAQVAGQNSLSNATSGVNYPTAVYPYPANGAIIGQGWDAFNGNGTSATCVEADAVRLERNVYSTNVRLIQSSYEMVKDTATSVSVAASALGFGASGGFSTANDRQINTDDQNFLFTFEASDGSTFAIPRGASLSAILAYKEDTEKLLASAPNAQERVVATMASEPRTTAGGRVTLTEAARKLLDAGKDGEFQKMCGQGFVAAIHRGTKVNLLLTQSNATRKDRESLAASLNVSGWGVSAGVSHTESASAKTTNANLGYRVYQEGGIPVKPPAIGANFDLSAILPNPEQLLANPTAFRVVVVPYSNIDPTVASRVPTPLGMLLISDYYLALSDVYNLIGSAIDEALVATSDRAKVFNFYGGVAGLQSVRDQIHLDMAFLETVLRQCYQGARTAESCTINGALKGLKKDLSADLARLQAAGAGKGTASTTPSVLSIDQFRKALTEKDTSKNDVKMADAFNKSATALDAARQSLNDNSLEQLVAAVKRFQADIQNDELSLQFFLRFYWYLTQIPLSTVDWSPSLVVPAANLREAKADSLRKELVRATLSTRLMPWKNHFCAELKSEYLCVPEQALSRFVETAGIRISDTEIVVVPPPPPAPPAPPRRNTCVSWVLGAPFPCW